MAEIRIVVTVKDDAGRAALDDLGHRLGELPGATAVVREKPPGSSRPFGSARFLLDVVLSSDDAVAAMAHEVETWLGERSPGTALTATAFTASTELRYPGAAAFHLDVVREGRDLLRLLQESSPRNPVETGDEDTAVDRAAATLDYKSVKTVLVGAEERALLRSRAWRRAREEAPVLPVSIYLGDGRDHERIEAAVEKALAQAGMSVIGREDPQRGSWFRNMRARLREAAATPAGREAMAVALHGLEQRVALEKDAVIAEKLMNGVQGVITALQPEQNAVVRMGPVLIVKADGLLTVLQLTPAQQLALNHRPWLHKEPHEVLNALSDKAQPGPETTDVRPAELNVGDKPPVAGQQDGDPPFGITIP